MMIYFIGCSYEGTHLIFQEGALQNCNLPSHLKEEVLGLH